MTEPYRLAAKIACRVARIDRQRLNEHVASGAYYIAPDPAKGGSRYFMEEDMIPLYVFARQTERGLNSKKAGNLASMLHDALRHGGAVQFQDETLIAVCYATNGSSFVLPGSKVLADLSAGNTVKPTPYEFDLFDLHAIRAELNSGVAYERSILGDDD